jgi:hypothetical protein
MKRTDIRLRDLRPFTIRYGLSVEQAARLVKRFGFDNEKLAAAAVVLAHRRQRLSETHHTAKQPGELGYNSAESL